MTSGETFLDAIKEGEIEKLRSMLEADPSFINTTSSKGISAVLLAAYYQRKEVLELLLLKDPELDIFESSATGKIDRVEALIKQDPNSINSYSKDGVFPLGLAAYFGHKDVVRFLLDNGADPNMVSNNEMHVKPIHSAAAHRHAETSFEIVKMLLSAGADPNATQEGGWTPLHQAAAHGLSNLVKLLLSHGADTNSKSSNGKTPLQMAIDNSHQEVEKILSEANNV
jgi:uncharacterized protein